MHDEEKRVAAEAAVGEVHDGMLIGLGTGTTAAHAISAVGRRVTEGLRVEAVATSDATRRAAEAAGIRVRDFAEVARVDLTIDGADEIDDQLRAIKGGGGAMVREKVVAASSDRMIVIADASKLVTRLGTTKLPIEVLPFAMEFVATHVAELGAHTEWRREGEGRYRTDQGNVILDAWFETMNELVELDRTLNALPGIVGHGLFLREVDAAYIARGETVTRLERDPGGGQATAAWGGAFGDMKRGMND